MKRTTASWLLWLWIAAVIWGAFEYAPLAAKFIGQSSRILFFHVPMAWAAFIAFMAAGVSSLRYLFGNHPQWDPLPDSVAEATAELGPVFRVLARVSGASWSRTMWRYLLGSNPGRDPRHDRAARAAVELGLVFGLLATVTGAIWSRIMWGAYWNWDPRQTSILMTLVFYGAYLALRDAVEDAEKRARLAAAYAVLGLVVTPFFIFVVPRITFSLHPEPVINSSGKVEMEARMLQVLLASGAGFTALFFWLHGLRTRLLGLEALAERSSATDAVGAPNVTTPRRADPAGAASRTSN